MNFSWRAVSRLFENVSRTCDQAVPVLDALAVVGADAFGQFGGFREIRGVDAAGLVQMRPDFFHGEAEDGREQADQRERRR